jgi:hypothetical protein
LNSSEARCPEQLAGESMKICGGCTRQLLADLPAEAMAHAATWTPGR